MSDGAGHPQDLEDVFSAVSALRQTQLEQGRVLCTLVAGQTRSEAQLVALVARRAILTGAVGRLADDQQQLALGQEQLVARVDALGALVQRLADHLLPSEQ